MINFLLISLVFYILCFLLFYFALRFVSVRKFLEFFVNNAISRTFIKMIFIVIVFSYFSRHHVVLAMEPDDIIKNTSESLFLSLGKSIAYYTGVTFCVTGGVTAVGWFMEQVWHAADMTVTAKYYYPGYYTIQDICATIPYPTTPIYSTETAMARFLAADIKYASHQIVSFLEENRRLNVRTDAHGFINIISNWPTIDRYNIDHLVTLSNKIANLHGQNIPDNIHVRFLTCMMVWNQYNYYDPIWHPGKMEELVNVYQTARYLATLILQE